MELGLRGNCELHEWTRLDGRPATVTYGKVTKRSDCECSLVVVRDPSVYPRTHQLPFSLSNVAPSNLSIPPPMFFLAFLALQSLNLNLIPFLHEWINTSDPSNPQLASSWSHLCCQFSSSCCAQPTFESEIQHMSSIPSRYSSMLMIHCSFRDTRLNQLLIRSKCICFVVIKWNEWEIKGKG